MRLGVDSYPEHWDPSLWPVYAAWMREAGFDVVRLAEFAWVKMEPEENRFEFGWLERAIDSLAKEGLSVVLGTPTAAMPAWLATKDPSVLATRADGTREAWGARRNNCFTSPLFRARSRAITEAMARRFGAHPAVIGWQTDNELAEPDCFCASCVGSFRGWLKRKHRTLEALNDAWGTSFWGHAFGSWEEIPAPTKIQKDNPGALLDWKRHFSDLNVDFQREQIEILRPRIANRFITHNTMGFAPKVNLFDLCADLDFASYDSYVLYGKEPEIRAGTAAVCDLVRGFKGRNFWIMEQSAGPHGWSSYGRNARPGEIRSASFQHVAHGADGLLWFRWRTALTGREQYWHGILGHDGVRGRRYEEVKRTCGDLRRIEALLEGTTVRSEAAILYDYDSDWALEIQPSYGEVLFGREDVRFHKDAFHRWHGAFFRAGINVDAIPTRGRDLSPYRVIVAPHLHLLPDDVAERLLAWVENGGVLVMDTRSAVKDEANRCHPRTLPGLLAPTFGIRVEEYESLRDRPIALRGTAALPGSWTGHGHLDWIRTEGAEALAETDLPGIGTRPVATRRRQGEGAAIYVGTVVKETSFYDAILARLAAERDLSSPVPPLVGLEQSVRSGENEDLVFLMNHLERPLRFPRPSAWEDLLGSTGSGEECVLEAFGVAVFRSPRVPGSEAERGLRPRPGRIKSSS